MGYTNFPNGLTSFGIPLPSAGAYSCPDVGTTYWVDGTNGLNGNSGLEPSKAFKTIQKAITTQIADATGLGDKIYVLPGTYTESLTGNLSQCKLIGYHPFAVRVQPADGHAYSGNLHDAVVAGFMFDNGTSTNQDYAAFRTTTVEDSIITNNLFGKQGGADENSVGVMFGTYATASTTVKFHRSVFSNNQIMVNGGGNTFWYGLGMCSGGGDATNANSRTMWNSRIENNIIGARQEGIRIIANNAGNYGTIIKNNVIVGDAINNGETLGYGMYFYDDTSVGQLMKIMVCDNRITSDADGIKNFAPQMTQGNIVGVGNAGTGTPAGETGFAS
jgi:hypothetical protein